ncbi:hypothetical protein TWF569_006894 [Orbilia oligospora]|uniref:Uncharacterized protein n=1 Tax=Orbilia oligospora TaxID=2813651 RepID=A0A7C8N885_ORBOL|nr:hypothetical protein TWF102_001118 [Orbilia oligospora]KAF3156312.1 hypothetical protein TWF569_006894 [Orbilia oligospora]
MAKCPLHALTAMNGQSARNMFHTEAGTGPAEGVRGRPRLMFVNWSNFGCPALSMNRLIEDFASLADRPTYFLTARLPFQDVLDLMRRDNELALTMRTRLNVGIPRLLTVGPLIAFDLRVSDSTTMKWKVVGTLCGIFKTTHFWFTKAAGSD